MDKDQDYLSDTTMNKIFYVLFKNYMIIFGVSILFLFTGYFGSSILKKTYTSDAIIIENPDDSSSMSPGNAMSGIASFVGVSMPSQITKADLAMIKIKSRDFLIEFINKHELKRDLFAASKFDQNSQKIVYDNNIYNYELNNWVKTKRNPQGLPPSDLEAYYAFSDLFSVYQSKDFTHYSVALEYISPFWAHDTLTKLIKDINEEMLTDTILETSRNIEYLSKAQKDISDITIRSLFSNILQDQISQNMLANVKDDFVFQVIDSPMLPERPSGPRKMIIALLSGIIGGILSIFYIIFCHFYNLRLPFFRKI